MCWVVAPVRIKVHRRWRLPAILGSAVEWHQTARTRNRRSAQGMGPTRAGKHGGRCVGPIPGSPRLTFTVLARWALGGTFGAVTQQNVAPQPGCDSYRESKRK